jgi:uncharacterized protein (DUF2235 family)
MPKNIVLCCDGTANEFAQNKTNVVKLFYTLEHDSPRQVTFYHPGLGTMEAPGALTSPARQMTRLLGKAIGYGLTADIRDAYVFLMNHFVPGDRVFLFGFSRGAFTVRAVASMLRMYGLIRKGNEPLVPYAIRMLTALSQRRPAAAGGVFDLAREFSDTFSAGHCKPWFVGVWDTVSSIGWIENPLKIPFTANNPDIEIGRHAISIDERRAFFRTNLWRLPAPPAAGGPRDLKQVWFAGVHCDVGGGYPESESGLSKITLEWMIAEAEAKGLLVDPAKRARVLGKPGSGYAAPDPTAVRHKSLTGWWCCAEFIPKRHYDWQTGKWGRRMNWFRPRTIPPGSLVHESVYLRGGYVQRLPADAVRVTSESYRSPPAAAAEVSERLDVSH